jgi:hypothetical protein
MVLFLSFYLFLSLFFPFLLVLFFLPSPVALLFSLFFSSFPGRKKKKKEEKRKKKVEQKKKKKSAKKRSFLFFRKEKKRKKDRELKKKDRNARQKGLREWVSETCGIEIGFRRESLMVTDGLEFSGSRSFTHRIWKQAFTHHGSFHTLEVRALT